MQERMDNDTPLSLAAVATLAQAAADTETPLGGFAPTMVEVGEGGLTLRRDALLSAPQRWAAHLSNPEQLADAVFLPPELKDGHAGEAADVYSLAVMTYLAAVGEAPVGALNLPALDRKLERGRARTVVQALSPRPALRPELRALARVLADATAPADNPSPGADAPAAASGASFAQEAVGPAPTVEDEADVRRRSFLQPMLFVGAVSVFVGALWFIWLSWGQLGDAARLMMITGLTGLVGGLSGGLDRADCQQAAATFRVLFTQLFWALGGFVLLMLDQLDSGLGWAFVGGIVALVSGAIGHLKGPRWALFSLTGLAGTVASVAFFTALEGWGQVCFFAGFTALFRGLLALAESGRLKAPVALLEVAVLGAAWLTGWWALVIDASIVSSTFICLVAWWGTRLWAHGRDTTRIAALAHLAGVATAALLLVIAPDSKAIWPSLLFPFAAALEVVLADRRGRDKLSDVAMALGTGSLWIVGFAIADASGRVDSGELALIGALCWMVTVALAFWRKGPATSAAAAVHLAVAAAFLGEHLSTGTWYGAPVYFLLVETALMGFALLAFRRRKALQRSHLWVAAFYALGSVVAGLDVLVRGDHMTFGALFPYLPALLMVPLLIGDKDSATRGLLGRGAVAGLVVLPGLQLVIEHDAIAYALWAAVVALAAVAAALLSPRLERVDDGSRAALRWLGSALAGVVIWFGFLHGGKDHILEAFPWVALVAGLTSALFGLGMGAVGAGSPTDGRRVQRFAAAGYLVPFFLWSVGGDMAYVLLLFIGGAALLLLGVAQRHRHVVFASAATLVLSFWLQFFLRLHDKLPTAVLLIGFGLAVLAFAIFYERRLKHLVQTVKSWPGI
jgi:hypothetical protein